MRTSVLVLAVVVIAAPRASGQCPTFRFQHYDGAALVPANGSGDPLLATGEAYGIVVDGIPPEHFPLEVTRVGFGSANAVADLDIDVYDTWPPATFFPTATYEHAGVSALGGVVNEVDVTPSGPMILTSQPFTVVARVRSGSLVPLHDGNGCSGGLETSIWHYMFVPAGWFSYCPGAAGDWAFWVEYRSLACSDSFCDASDGSLASCPCGNAGDPDTGCDLQQGTGGVDLTFVRQEVSPLNRATLSSSGYPTIGNPTTVLLRSPSLDPSSPVVFGDGLRCVSVPLLRLDVTFASGGSAEHRFGHGAMAGTGAFYYQLWLRNNPAMFCTPESFNLSSGATLTW